MAEEATKEPCRSPGIRVSGVGCHTDRGVDLVCGVGSQTDRPKDRLTERRSALGGRGKGAFGTWLREVEDRRTEFADPCENSGIAHGDAGRLPAVHQFLCFSETWLFIEIHNAPPVLPISPTDAS
jgi:hypothetical protein